jgi:hypothetical protein
LCNGDNVADRGIFSSHSARSGVGLYDLFRPGDHVCYFFRSGDEAGEVLVPYFKAGLERNEQCVWLTGHLYGKDRAVSEMRAAVADFDRRVSAGQVYLSDHEEWYATLDGMSVAEKVRGWAQQKDKAVAAGYAGLRASGNASFVDADLCDEFLTCERASNAIFPGQPIVVLCGYCFERCSPRGVVDVVHCHGLGLAKRHGHWGLVEVRNHAGVAPEAAAGRGHDAAPPAPEEELRQVVEDQLAMFIAAEPERIGLEGGDVRLSGSQATKLGIVLSELAANAAKYGALASRQGRLVVQWRVVSNGSRRLQLTWIESGGADLALPDTIGSGTRLLATMAENSVRTFGRTGMACTFELTLEDGDG